MNYQNTGKRAFDLIFATVGIVFLFPLFLFIGVLLKLFSKNGILFSQIRPGRSEKLFRLYKFKSLRDKFDENGNRLAEKSRKTSIGTFLRTTSLDEIPQLWNVFIGNMSIVGPRPLLEEYLPLYSELQRKRHNVKPGITGWAQINGRNTISWQKKFELDIWYVNHFSFWLDLKILFLTIPKVLLREKINASEGITMRKFEGN